MPRTLAMFLLVLTTLAMFASASPPPAAAGETAAPDDRPPIDLGIGGVGGVYFLAEPGELVIEVEKRDRNRRSIRTELRAILAGPDRRVVQEITIPDDGTTSRGPLGPPQRARLATQVERKGIYVLNITVSRDRYGDNIIWGFRTNCPQYLIETARGHRDRRHEEPIVLLNSGHPADVCFLPRQGEFDMEVTGLPKAAEALRVYDAEGTLIETLKVGADGQASHRFPADVHRDAVPWRLHLPDQPATVQIDGVTRWTSRDLCPNCCLWSPDPASFFPLAQYRWLLTPYSRTVYGEPGEKKEIAFQVHNNSLEPTTIELDLEFPQTSWPLELSARRLAVPAGRAEQVRATCTVPAEGETAVCHLRATPKEQPGFSTYSTVMVKAGPAPASKPLDMPMVLKPYAHENEQFGYLPDYPVDNQIYFDLQNRPYVRTGAGIETLRDGKWTATNFASAVTSRVPQFEGKSFGIPSAKIAFDRDGDVYTLASAGRKIALLHSRDGGETWTAYLIPGREGEPRSFDIEQFSGHNLPDGPPPILRYTRTAKDPDVFWRSLQDLELFCPKKVDGRIVIGEPVMLTKKCIGLAAHSGIPSCVVSRATKVHAVWAEATDPKVKVSGVPTFVASYDGATGTVGEPALVGYGPPANDIHNTPSITIDSQGYLHVLTGTHGRPFPYARSLAPNDAHSGWTEPAVVGEGLRQTYIGLVCGSDDALHSAFRLWKFGEEPFPASHHATLACQRRPAGNSWEPPQVLIVPPFSEYSVYYHRLTIDRVGRLFLSYDYWSTYWFYRNDHRGSRRALMMSPDGGKTWKLVETRDFLVALDE